MKRTDLTFKLGEPCFSIMEFITEAEDEAYVTLVVSNQKTSESVSLTLHKGDLEGLIYVIKDAQKNY